MVIDVRFTYSTSERERLDIYAPPDVQPPDDIVCVRDGKDLLFMRLSDRSLECDDVFYHPTTGKPIKGHCNNPDCHRQRLGHCGCGRHLFPVRFEAAT